MESAELDAAEDRFVGPVRAAYWGWASDPEVRLNGASGGVVTAIINALLEQNLVDAALLTRWRPDHPLEQEPFIARSVAQVSAAQGSRYCPVALNSLAGELSEFDRVVVVGLPCHLHGLLNANMLRRERPEIIAIGLFCDRTLSRLVIDRLTSSVDSTGPIDAFEYRSKNWRGWPGDVCVKPTGSPPVFIDRGARMRLKEYYTPVRCRICFDKLNILADIACGDGWGAQNPPHEGLSSILVRTRKGEDALDHVGEALELHTASISEVIAEQWIQIRKRDCAAFTTAYRRQLPGAPVPMPGELAQQTPNTNLFSARSYARRLRAALRFEMSRNRSEAQRLIWHWQFRDRVIGLLTRTLKLPGRVLHRLLVMLRRG